jgi:hypothetical protein
MKDIGDGVDFYGFVDELSGDYFCVRAQVDGGGLNGGKKCCGEIARIDAVLVDEGEVPVAGGELRKNMRKSFGRERVC